MSPRGVGRRGRRCRRCHRSPSIRRRVPSAPLSPAARNPRTGRAEHAADPRRLEAERLRSTRFSTPNLSQSRLARFSVKVLVRPSKVSGRCLTRVPGTSSTGSKPTASMKLASTPPAAGRARPRRRRRTPGRVLGAHLLEGLLARVTGEMPDGVADRRRRQRRQPCRRSPATISSCGPASPSSRRSRSRAARRGARPRPVVVEAAGGAGDQDPLVVGHGLQLLGRPAHGAQRLARRQALDVDDELQHRAGRARQRPAKAAGKSAVAVTRSAWVP